MCTELVSKNFFAIMYKYDADQITSEEITVSENIEYDKSDAQFWLLYPLLKYHRLVSVAKRAITWDTPWVSEVFVFLKYVHYQKKTEYYTYDGVKRVISHLVRPLFYF